MGTSGVKVGVLDLSNFSLIALVMMGQDNSPSHSARGRSTELKESSKTAIWVLTSHM